MDTEPKTFKLGGILDVNRLGYGAMRLTGQPGNFGPYADWDGGKALLRRAAELGVNFFDTAHAYGPGDNEALIADALYPYADKKGPIVVATKGGVTKNAPDNIRADGRPETLRAEVEASLRLLKRDAIDLYQLHRPDPRVPLADSAGALAELQAAGKIRFIGLSNVSVDQYREARSIATIASVQNRLNLADTGSLELLRATEADGAAFIPYGPLGAHPMRPGSPLAADDGRLAAIARRLNAKPGQVALAWLLHLAPHTIVIPGTTSIGHLEDNVRAADLSLSDEDMASLGATPSAPA